MAVEILILSGTRQGERLVFDKREFRVGSDAACEVFFDERTDPAICGRSAAFRFQEDGWYLRGTGGEVLVNQQLVTGWMRIRSGDVVRMSESGPDFSFSIVTGVTASVAPAAKPSTDRLSATPIVEGVPNPTVEQGNASTQQSSIVELVEPAYHTTSVAATPAKADQRWTLWVGGGLAVTLVVILLGRALLAPPTIVVHLGPNGVSSVPGDSTSTVSASSLTRQTDRKQTDPSGPETPPATTKQEEAEKKNAEEKKRLSGIEAQLGKAVYLIQVEKAGRSWPFATCIAVSHDTLLSTAREVAQLAKWREEGEFKIWVTQPAHNIREEVKELRINGVFASLAEKPGDWVYYNLGLLSVGARLPEIAPLATHEELFGVEEGMPLACFGFFHEGEKTTRFDNIEPRLAKGKIYVITADQTLPGKPRLLHAKADISKFAYGSPVVNSRGAVLGVYSEEASPPNGKQAGPGPLPSMNLHYVSLVVPEMINMWLQDHNAQVWPTVVGTPKVQKTQDPR